MSNPVHDLHLDFETYCDLDLSQVGIHRYTTHPSFMVLAVAWKIDERPTRYQYAPPVRMLHPDLERALANRNVQGHAFNAAFETAVLMRLGIAVANPISCTMQRALAYGLPGRLEKAAEALGLVHLKDKAGRALMLRMTKPLKAGAPPWITADFDALGRYCAADVDAEAELAGLIPKLPPEEWALSQIDAAMNTRGELGIDLARVQTLTAVALDAERADANRCAHLTSGAVTSPGTQTARLLAWFATQGIPLADTQRATIEEELLTCAAPDAREVLQIRLRMARASPRKLARMDHMADDHDALRGQFQFVGAGRTGRWSGRGVQVQNLPRVPKDFKPNTFYDLALRTVIDSGSAVDLGTVTPYPVLDCVAYSLRSCLKATDDARHLWSFDFSQIEARVLAWLAGQRDILAVFASGEDVYTWAAAQFYSNDRQLGKVLVLALGFGMGATKLQDTARKAYGVTMTPGQAERFKEGWRRANHHIVRFWYEMENAAKTAILNRGFVCAVGGSGVAFTCTARTLQMRLPSGRVLYYHQPRLDADTGSIVYWGTEVGNRWALQRTWGGKLAENATQAAARDIMSEAMLRAFRRHSLVPCMTVHDELVYAISGQYAVEDSPALEKLMLEPPPWAGGLPLAGEHKIMRRYGVPIRNI